MVWTDSEMRGFCANMKSHCIDALNGMDDVAVVEKSRTISVARKQTQGGKPWGLARISTAGDITGSSMGLNYTYSWDSANTKTLPGAGADIYLIDSGINTEHWAFGGRAKMIWPNSTTSDDFGYSASVFLLSLNVANLILATELTQQAQQALRNSVWHSELISWESKLWTIEAVAKHTY